MNKLELSRYNLNLSVEYLFIGTLFSGWKTYMVFE